MDRTPWSCCCNISITYLDPSEIEPKYSGDDEDSDNGESDTGITDK